MLGLKKYGKGDWRNISRNFVTTRTPTQVASHAQKYFIRQLSGGKDKRRSSIHDITTVNLNETKSLAPDKMNKVQNPDPNGINGVIYNPDPADHGSMLGFNGPGSSDFTQFGLNLHEHHHPMQGYGYGSVYQMYSAQQH